SRLGEVRLDEARLSAGPPDTLDRLVQGARQPALAALGGSGGDHDVCALHGEPRRDCLADAATGAGDQGVLALQSSIGIDARLTHDRLLQLHFVLIPQGSRGWPSEARPVAHRAGWRFTARVARRSLDADT